MRKIRQLLVVAVLVASSAIYANENGTNRTFSFEALYGFTGMNDGGFGKNQFAHEGGLRAIILTNTFTHEVLGRYAINPKMNDGGFNKYQSWEAEYRFGYRMDQDMATRSLGMIMGGAYFGLGYQQEIFSASGTTSTDNYIYMPFGFWGEDATDYEWLKIRYGLNFKAIFWRANWGKIGGVSNNEKFKFQFNVGGKLYAGVGFNMGNVADFFVQGYFSYNIPQAKRMMYGVETGFQF